MVKTVLLATLWGLASWTWVAIAHVFLGTPDISVIVAAVIATAILARAVLKHPHDEQRAAAPAYAPKAS